MLGAIIGDIVGSIYEFESDKTKYFELFTEESRLNVLGDFAPETILVLENIAAIYTKLGFRITAKILYNTVRKRKLGLY